MLRPVDSAGAPSYALTNALTGVALAELVRVKRARHRIEELFAEGNGDVGLDHWEVRSWLGWRHHMTPSLLALWFLQVEKRRLGKKRRGSRPASSARS